MKKWLLIIIAAFLLGGYAAYSFHLIDSEKIPINVNEYRVLIVYDKANQPPAI